MRLHLDSSATGPLGVQSSSVSGSSSTSSGRSQDTHGSKDSISISTTSAALSQIASDRASRIQQISNAITAGTYQVSSAAVGRALVAQAFS